MRDVANGHSGKLVSHLVDVVIVVATLYTPLFTSLSLSLSLSLSRSPSLSLSLPPTPRSLSISLSLSFSLTLSLMSCLSSHVRFRVGV